MEVSHLGSYTGTGAAISITAPGFQPSYICIWNDTDNDVKFEFFGNMTAGTAIKLVAAGTFVPAALTLTGSTPVFTGSAPYAAQTLAVTHDATPGGTEIYLKFMEDGSPYLACNMATDTVSKALNFSGGDTIFVQHDASASSGGLQVYITTAGALIVNNTKFGAAMFLKLRAGGLLQIGHDASASSSGTALFFDDGTDERFEANFSDTTSHNMSSEVQGWKSVTPAGTNAQVTVTGNSAGSISNNISEVSSQGLTLSFRGFDIGTDSLINESGKAYRYLAIR